MCAQDTAQIEPNGECPECEFYETRLMEELDTLTRSRSEESIAAIHAKRYQNVTVT